MTERVTMDIRLRPTIWETRLGKRADGSSSYYVMLRGVSPNTNATIAVAYPVGDAASAEAFKKEHGLIGLPGQQEQAFEVWGVVIDERTTPTNWVLQGHMLRKLEAPELATFRDHMRFRDHHEKIMTAVQSATPETAMTALQRILESSNQYAASIGYIAITPDPKKVPAPDVAPAATHVQPESTNSTADASTSASQVQPPKSSAAAEQNPADTHVSAASADSVQPTTSQSKEAASQPTSPQPSAETTPRNVLAGPVRTPVAPDSAVPPAQAPSHQPPAAAPAAEPVASTMFRRGRFGIAPAPDPATQEPTSAAASALPNPGS